mgnify:CR=1 FL=1
MKRPSKAELRAAAERSISQGALDLGCLGFTVQDYWFYATLAEVDPVFLEPYLPQLWENLDRNNSSIIRCGLSVFRKVKLPSDLEGEVFAFCMQLLHQGNQPVAVLSFALWICAKISALHPSLWEETLERVKYYRERRSDPGIQSAANAILRLSTRH